MATLGNVFQLFKDLKTEFSKGSRDLKKCGDLLEQLKVKIEVYLEILMTQLDFFVDKSHSNCLHTNIRCTSITTRAGNCTRHPRDRRRA